MSDVKKTLEDRGEVYGDYYGGSKFRADVMNLINRRYKLLHGKPMDPLHAVYIYDIINKISRLTVTPDHIDTWHDIAGYATLIEGALTDAKK